MHYKKYYYNTLIYTLFYTIAIFFLINGFAHNTIASTINVASNKSKNRISSTSELHLILLWEKARYKEKDITQDISKHLKILELYDITWSKEEVSNNFSRFYGIKLGQYSGKEEHCGNGGFLLLTVLDEDPKYDFVQTSRGTEYVNINIFNLKEKYRSWTDGGHKIHATNNPTETNHDITLLLGLNYDDYLNKMSGKTNNNIQKINRDLVGAKGFTSMEEIFYLLNATCEYAVLRNYEILPEQLRTEEHGDIDIITNNPQNIALLLNASKVYPKSYRIHYKTTTSQQEVYFDFRYLADHYYCKNWEYDLLKTRKLNEKNIYVLDDEQYFYSLIYHAIIHKHIVAKDYYKKIENLFYTLKLNEKYSLDNYDNEFDLYFELLLKFMNKKGYYFTKPDDISVAYYDKFLYADDKIDYLTNNYLLTDIKQTRLHEKSGADFIYFTGLNNTQEKVFIKWGGFEDSVKKEYEIGRKLHKEDPRYFIKPLQYKYDQDIKFIIYPYIKGANLQSAIDNNSLTDDDKIKIIKQLREILNVLHKNNYIHRDIRPTNLILTEDKNLILIDFQFCVDLNNYQEFDMVYKNPEKIQGLGADFKFKKYIWDDAYSINKIIETIGCPQQYQSEYDMITQEVKQMIGKKQQAFIFDLNSIIKKWTKDKFILLKTTYFQIKSKIYKSFVDVVKYATSYF